MSLASRRAARTVAVCHGHQVLGRQLSLHICLKGLSGIRIDRSTLQFLRADNGVDNTLSSESFRGGRRYL